MTLGIVIAVVGVSFLGILIAGLGAFRGHWYLRKASRLRRDPKTFHAWAVEHVAAAQRKSGQIPLYLAQYFIGTATREWALAVGLDMTQIKFIEDIEQLGLHPLMRFQVSLPVPAQSYFSEQVQRQNL